MTDTASSLAGRPLGLWPLAAGFPLLAFLWFGPLPGWARGSFAAHMVMHMGVVAVVAPFLAVGIARRSEAGRRYSARDGGRGVAVRIRRGLGVARPGAA